MNVNEFWNRVKTLQKEKRITQEVLAEKCNISYRTLQGWISKEIFPDVADAYRIANYLGTTVEYLLTGSSSVPKNEKAIKLATELLSEISK